MHHSMQKRNISTVQISVEPNFNDLGSKNNMEYLFKDLTENTAEQETRPTHFLTLPYTLIRIKLSFQYVNESYNLT